MNIKETYKYILESVNTNNKKANTDSLGADKTIKNYALVEEFRKRLKEQIYDWEEKYFTVVFNNDNPDKWHDLKENNLPTNEDEIPEIILSKIWAYGSVKGYGNGTKAYLYFKRFLYFRTKANMSADQAYNFCHRITVQDFQFLTKAGMTPFQISENINGKINRNIFNLFKSYGYDLESCLNKACYFRISDEDISKVKDLINLLKYLGENKKDALNQVINKYGYYQYFDFDPSLSPKQREDSNGYTQKMYYDDTTDNKKANYYLMLKYLAEWRKEEQNGESNTYIINQGRFQDTIPNPRAKNKHSIYLQAFTGKTDYIKDIIFGSPTGYGKKVKIKQYKSIKAAWKDFIRLYNIEEKFHFQEYCYITKYKEGDEAFA